MRTLYISKSTETINYDIHRMRRDRRNIYQCEENNTEYMNIPTGNYSVDNIFPREQLKQTKNMDSETHWS